MYGGNVRNVVRMQALGVLVLLGAGLWTAGCKSAPPLTQAQALTLIQAKYDSTPATPYSIWVSDQGMQQGVKAKYWAGTKRYPNGYWADFTLTPDGKKVLKLAAGGDTIQWRPSKPYDAQYAITVLPLVSSHLKASNLGEVQNLADDKTVTFTEEVTLDGLPDALKAMAHDHGNTLSTKRLATFTLINGAWSLKSIE